MEAISTAILSDMRTGLARKKSYQDMILTYFDPSSVSLREKSVVVIDAGGTNFRSSLVTFQQDGKAKISGFEKTKMPGTSGELSKKEFFGQIASNINRFKDKCDEICFCFSYAMEITKDHDGILNSFSKEVKAPEVVGSHIGAELKNALAEHGWTHIPAVILLNDTVAALLAGSGNKSCSSYIGFILGTGMNCAYVQPKDETLGIERQIVVCESAKFGGVAQSDFDREMDKKSVNPGTSPLEKLCSGAYLGPIATEILRTASREGLFSSTFAAALEKRNQLSLIEVSSFLEQSAPARGTYADLFAPEHAQTGDCEIVFELFDALVDRTAHLAASILAAAVIQCNEGTVLEKPVCIAFNGTTFFKTYKVPERTKAYLSRLLEGKSLRYEILPGEADITAGTAMAALA